MDVGLYWFLVFVLGSFVFDVMCLIFVCAFHPPWPKRIATPAGELMIFECGTTLLRDTYGALRVVMQGALSQPVGHSDRDDCSDPLRAD